MELVFLHGAGCTADVFGEQIAAFPHAIALTLPGHTTPGTPASIEQFADFVAAELERRDMDDVILCGHSMGAAIALEVALRQNPRLAGLVVLGSGAKMRVGPAIFEAIERNFEDAARMIARFFYAEPSAERSEASATMMLRVGKAQTQRDFKACDSFDVTERLAGIVLPLLALTGEHDILMPPKFSEDLAHRIPGAQARILSGAGHFAMVECPTDTNEAIRGFVNQIER